jgi:TonB family protein
MHPTPLEPERSFLRSTECVLASILAHLGVLLLAVDLTEGGRRLPTDEREARVFFLLPPDRVDVTVRQHEVFKVGKLGGDLLDGGRLTMPGEGFSGAPPAYGARGKRQKSGARGEVPFGPVSALVPDSVFSVLEVDEMVQRYPESAAPVYPPDLLADGAEGLVQAIYVVDSTGWVDMSSIEVVTSDDSLFTESVLTALGQMRFRPAKRAGQKVRQRVEQKFRFKIAPASEVVDRTS